MAGVKGRSGGQNKLPTELKQIRGTEKPSRAKPLEPKPTPGIPLPPDYFTVAQVACYDRLVANLKSLNVIALSDGDALVVGALAMDEMIMAEKEIREGGMLIDISTVVVRETKRVKTTTRRAAYTKHPLIAVKSDASNRLFKVLQAFGMTPQSRSSVSTLGNEEEKSEFFN